MKYTKKPITIEAIQFNGHNQDEIKSFVGRDLESELESETAYVAGVAPPVFSLIIPTLEGEMKAMPSDYIIKGIKGEFYPCKPDIFAASYNPAAMDRTDYDKCTSTKHNSVCLSRAADDEPIFVLRAKDPTAPEIVAAWVERNTGVQPKEKLDGAIDLSVEMIAWKNRNIK